jgi:hypothetical protein
MATDLRISVPAEDPSHEGVPEVGDQKFVSGLSGSGVENPKPGNEGTITSNASAGSPPWAAGSASGSITLDQCQNV